MMSDKNAFQVLQLFGAPYERGLTYGKEKEEDILSFVEYFYSLTGGGEDHRQAVLQRVRRYLPYIEEYSPPLYRELEGVARGCGCLFEEVVMLALHEELESFVGHCTSFALTGEAAADGKALQGQSWDIPVALCQKAHPFLLLRGGGQDPVVFSFTYAGLLAGAGFNGAGITLSWNSLPRLKMQVGVPTYVIIAEVLRQETIGGAIEAVSRAQRAGCFTFVITDREEIYMVEATPDDLDLFYCTSSMGHANHYLSPKFKDLQSLDMVISRYRGSSIIRQNRMDRLLKEAQGRMQVKDCRRLLLDHVNYPHSICRHPADGDETPMITCAAWVIEPKKNRWWVSKGPPCQGGFLPYSLQEVERSP